MARWMTKGGFKLAAALAAVLSFATGSARAADTDGDGFPDGLETALGTDPLLASSTPTGTNANAQTFTPGVSIFLGFQQNDSVVLFLDLGTATPSALEGKQVAYSIGGVSRGVTLDATGSGADALGTTFASVTTSEGQTFLSISTSGDLAPDFVDEGLLQSVTGVKAATIDASFFFDGVVYADSALSGIYQVETLPDGMVFGVAQFNSTASGDDSGANFEFSDVEVLPSPAAVGATISVKLDLESKGINLTTLAGVIDFGDGSQPVVFDETQLTSLTHVYAAEGVYDIEIAVLGETMPKGDSSATTISVSATAFAIIGDDAALNPENGIVSSADVVDSNGNIPGGVNYNIKSLEDNTVTGATTEFELVDGESTQAQGQFRGRDVTDGLTPSRSSAGSELVVAKTTTKSTSGQTRGVVRKTVAVGSRNAKPNDSANPKPPKVNPGVVTVSKVSGKFIFKGDSGNKPDQVTFSGSITLPEGFSPDSPNGIRFAIGMGNVLDGVFIDAKGKPKTAGGDNSRLKKVQIKYPKLSGPATGTEVAKISVTMSTLDMDLKGFESEGIMNRRRDDEEGQKVLDRFMQVNMLLGGEPYDAYIPVQFKLAPKGDAGSFVSRKSSN